MRTYSSQTAIIVALVSLLLVAGAYFFGYTVGHQNLVFENGYRPKIANTELRKPREIDFSLFWDVWAEVTDKFAGQVDNQKMIGDAINGALSSLDDPYTHYLSPDEAKRLNDDLNGNFDGIGAKIELRDNLITVFAPLEGSPAEKVGLRGKDVIVKIDGVETKGMSLDEAIDKIRGQKGTSVKLTIVREGEPEPLDFDVVRDTIVIKSVKWEMKDGQIAYLNINQFGADTIELLEKQLSEIIAAQPKGIIVDVRNNPGGFLDVAVDASSLFIKDRGAIVKEEDKGGRLTEKPATLKPQLVDQPLIVLVNAGSASASEIFAGAVQDYGRGRLIGETTFGKGSVQVLESVRGGGAVRITVAKWLTPKGRHINKQGIDPDIKVELTAEDIKAEKDPQLEKALAELTAKQ